MKKKHAAIFAWLFIYMCPWPQPLAMAAIEQQNIDKKKPEHQPVLTRAPELKTFEHAKYPESLLEQGIGGEVRLFIDIDEHGLVERVELIESTHPDFTTPAMNACTHFVFLPAEVDHAPAAIRIEYKYVFKPQVIVPKTEKTEVKELPINFLGLVREAGNREPLEGVVIYVDDKPIAETDKQGEFSLRGLSIGTHKIKIFSQYHETYETEEEISKDEATKVKYYLVRESLNPYQIVLRAQRDRREVSKVQLAREEVTKVPGTFGDPVRVIENLPGMGRTPGGLGGALLVRGERPSSTAVFLDGVKIPLLYHFFGLTSVVNAEFLEQIEFYSGGFSARYGDATAGIVDVTSRDLDCELWRGSAEVDLIDSAVFTCVPVGSWKIAAAARRSYIDLILPWFLDKANRNRDEDEGSVTASPVYWDYQTKAQTSFGNHKLDLFAFGSDDRFKLIRTGSAEDISIDFKLHLSSHRFLAKHEWNPNDKIKLTSSIAPGYVVQEFLQESAEFDASTEFKLGAWLLDWRDELTFQINDMFTLRTGLDHRFGQALLELDVPLPSDLRQFPKPTFDYTQTDTYSRKIWQFHQGYYSELEINPGYGVRIIPGLRIERWDFFKTQDFSVLPRITARYAFIDSTAVKAAYGIYEKLPEAGFLLDSFGNPKLPPERSQHFVLGVEHQFTELINVDLQGFYNKRSNQPSASASVLYKNGKAIRENWTSSGTGYAYGAELLLRHLATQEGRFYGWIAYTLSRSVIRDRNPDATYMVQQADGSMQEYRYGEDAARKYLSDYDQTHILTVVGQWVLPWGLEAGFRYRLVSGNPYTPLNKGNVFFDADADAYLLDMRSVKRNSGRMPTFHQLDVRLDKTWTFDLWKLTAYLEIINAYNQKNVEMYQYDYRYRERVPLSLLPFVPVIGVKGEF